MRGLTFPGDRTVELREFRDPEPGPREIVVRVRASGICGTDLKFYHGDIALPPPLSAPDIIAGHEPSGDVVAVGSAVTDAEARLGQRVMIHHYGGCGVCEHCRSGWTQMCIRGASAFGLTAHGGHADYLRIPVSAALPLPDELSYEEGAALSCGTTTAWAALKRLGLSADSTIAIFGQGPVGLSATLLAHALGARVVAVDLSNDRLHHAKQLGADKTINPGQIGDTVDAVRELTAGLGADATLDASGSPAARRQAVQAVKAWGQVCFVGEGGDVTLDVSADLLRKQVTLHGSWTFSTLQQAACAAFVAQRGIALDAIFTDRWTLDNADRAYQLFDQQVAGKGVFLTD
jgi:2-desacetyl-2-hydroxyethyl bacteriochlorophyllide A dehydrogenase